MGTQAERHGDGRVRLRATDGTGTLQGSLSAEAAAGPTVNTPTINMGAARTIAGIAGITGVLAGSFATAAPAQAVTDIAAPAKTATAVDTKVGAPAAKKPTPACNAAKARIAKALRQQRAAKSTWVAAAIARSAAAERCGGMFSLAMDPKATYNPDGSIRHSAEWFSNVMGDIARADGVLSPGNPNGMVREAGEISWAKRYLASMDWEQLLDAVNAVSGEHWRGETVLARSPRTPGYGEGFAFDQVANPNAPKKDRSWDKLSRVPLGFAPGTPQAYIRAHVLAGVFVDDYDPARVGTPGYWYQTPRVWESNEHGAFWKATVSPIHYDADTKPGSYEIGYGATTFGQRSAGIVVDGRPSQRWEDNGNTGFTDPRNQTLRLQPDGVVTNGTVWQTTTPAIVR